MAAMNVLIVDDDPQLVRILQAVLKPVEAELRVAGTGRLALQMAMEAPPSLLLLDMRLPDMTGMEVLREVAARGTPTTVIVMTAHGSVDLAVEAMREGAYDFLTKPLDLERLRVMVRNAVERQRIIRELDDFKAQQQRTRFRGLAGSSPAMQRLYRQLRATGATNAPVLLVAEPGSETDACARSIHDESPRASAPFVEASAAGATPESLAEALASAGAGTLFLAAAERLPAPCAEPMQEFLATARWLGKQLPARLVAAAEPSFDTADAIPAQLRVALGAARIHVPPLRERGEDVLDLADQMLERLARDEGRSFAGFDDEAQVALVSYPWPGNRAELERAIAHAVRSNEGRMVTREMLPEAVRAAAEQATGASRATVRGLEAGAVRPLWQVEKDEIEKALRLCEGNVLAAARLLHVSPATIYRKQQSWRALAS